MRFVYRHLGCLKKAVLIPMIILIAALNLRAQNEIKKPLIPNELNVFSSDGYNWFFFNATSHSLYKYLANQAFELIDERTTEVAGLMSLTEWQKRQDYINETLMRDIIGPFPVKNSLNAQITRTINKKEFRIDHVIFESQPKFYVTASLFIPGSVKKVKAPAILFCSGHTEISYRSEDYQRAILNLVKKGFIVLAIDPVGQGERLEYYDPGTGKSLVGTSTKEHSYPGTQAFIVGSSQARYMTWDGIRAVDYLLTRKEVDPDRIGITGCSGGGTQTAYIAALDERIKASAILCYITNFTRLLQLVGPTDGEQSLYNSIYRKIDHADLITVRAPKPAMVLSTTDDFFNIQGARETAREVSRIYQAYGKPLNFEMVEDIGRHGMTKKNREAMYSFFQKHLDNQGSPSEDEVTFLSKEELQVCSTGQVSTSLKGETVFSLNLKEAERLMKDIQVSRNNLTKHIPGVLKSAKQLSGFHESEEYNEPVFAGYIQRGSYKIEKYFVKGEGDYVIPYLLMIPDKPGNKALIYLHQSGKSAEAHEGGEIERFVKNGFTVLAPDMLGIGETGPGHFRGSAVFDSVNLNIWFGSVLIGRSIVGIRAGDLVNLTTILKKDNKISEIYGLARKEMAPILLHAAAFDPDIKRIALIEPYSSYRQIVMSKFYNPKFIYGSVPGALKAYDLPDLAASLAPRKLMVINITDGLGKIIDPDGVPEDIAVIKNSYKDKDATGQLKIMTLESSERIFDAYMEWIE